MPGGEILGAEGKRGADARRGADGRRGAEARRGAVGTWGGGGGSALGTCTAQLISPSVQMQLDLSKNEPTTLTSKVVPSEMVRSAKPPGTLLLAMDTVTSSSSWQPLTVTSESWSFPTLPEKRQGVSSPGMLLVGERKITSVLFSSSWIFMDRSVSQMSCTSATSLTTSGGDGTCSQLSMCSLVKFCSSVHSRPGFKLCPRKLHSFFVQLFPDFVHMQLLQSSIQFSPISLGVPSPSRHCESAPVLKPDMAKGRAKLQSIFVQLLPDSVHMQLLQSSIQLSPTSLAAPLLSTQVTAFSPNLPGEEATNAPVSSSSSSWRTWQMTFPLSQEQSLWFPLTSTPEDLSSSSHASSHSSHISRCCF